MTLETSGPQLSYFRADRSVCNVMSLANGLIKNLGTPDLNHWVANKSYVDTRFLDYTPTWLMDTKFDSLYARKSDLQTTDQRMLTLLRNISASTIPDPFAFLDYSVIFLPRQSLVFPFTQTICYHFDPVASFSFEPALIYLDTIIISQLGILPPYIHRGLDHRRNVYTRPTSTRLHYPERSLA